MSALRMLHSRWCREHLKRQNTGTSLSLPHLLYELLINIYLIKSICGTEFGARLDFVMTGGQMMGK